MDLVEKITQSLLDAYLQDEKTGYADKGPVCLRRKLLNGIYKVYLVPACSKCLYSYILER
jgi:hypothetical protein